MANTLPSFRDFLQQTQINPVDYSGIKTNSQASANPIPVVYGLQRVVPPRIFVSVSPLYPDKLVCVYALSEGPCLGIYRLFVDDTYVQTDQAMILDNDGSPNGTANTITVPASGPYAGIARFEFMSGRELALNTESKLLKMHFSSNRPQYDDNLCFMVCEFTYSGEDSIYNSIPNIAVDMFGKQVRAANNLNNTVETYTTDPIACLADYLTNTVYGGGFPHSALDQTTFTAASTYAYANTQIDLSTGQTVTTPLYSCNTVIDTSSSVRTNVEQFLKNYNLLMPYMDGKFHIIPEKTDTTQVDFTENSIVGQVRITYPDLSTKYNAIYYSYQDPQNGFALTRARYPVSDADVNALVAEDGGYINNFNLDLNNITDPLMAERIAKTFLNKSRGQVKYEFDVFKDAWKYRVGDACRIKLTIPNVDYEEIRITRMTLTADNLVLIEAYSHADEFYHPFTDFYPTVPDYRKPLIPGIGGVVLPSRPSEPIGIIPPSDGNPDPTPISPVPIPPSSPTPITPDNPAPPAPAPQPTPVEPTYDINVSGPTTIGADNEYYSALITTKSAFNSITATTIDSRYTSNISGQYAYTYWQPYSGWGVYILQHALTFRNAVTAKGSEISYVYELPNGKFGIQYRPTNQFQYAWTAWDPEFPTTYAEQYFAGTTTKITERYTEAASLPMTQTYKNNSRYYASTTSPLTFISYGGEFKSAPGRFDYIYPGAVLSPLAPNTKTNFQSSPFSFDITVKYFYRDTLKFIGKKTFRMGASAMTALDLDNQRLSYKQQCNAGVEVPF